MRYTRLPILIVALVVVALPWSARATVSTTNYQIDPEGDLFSSTATLSTTTYQMDGSVTPIAGRNSTTNFVVESGSAFCYDCGDGFLDPNESCDGNDNLGGATCVSRGFSSGTLACSSSCAFDTSSCTAAGGGGGGGGGGAPDEPVVSDEIVDLEFTYATSLLLYGTMDSDTDQLTVNDESEDVEFIDDDSWEAVVALSYGLNSFTLVASDGSQESDETVYEIYRRLIGDVNQDDTVDDYDLSRMVRLWGDEDREGDFNEDETIDDYDFSMMVARWGLTV